MPSNLAFPIWATGRRKTAVASVRLTTGGGKFEINRRTFENYFPNVVTRNFIVAPFPRGGSGRDTREGVGGLLIIHGFQLLHLSPNEKSGAFVKPIRTLFWDVGGVLLTNAWDHEERDRAVEKFQLQKADFERFGRLIREQNIKVE